MTDYTPSMPALREAYIYERVGDGRGAIAAGAEFDRAIVAHDRQVAAQALREAAEALRVAGPAARKLPSEFVLGRAAERSAS